MAQITLEDKKHLKQLVNQLEEVNWLLRTISKKMVRYMLCSYLYLLIWVVLFVISRYFIYSFSIAVCIFCVCCLMYVILTMYFHLLIKPTNRKYKDTYRKGLSLLADLINYVDWEKYRKRQLYNETDSRVENAVAGFLKYARCNISPSTVKNKVFYVFMILQILLCNIVYLFSVMVFIQSLKEYLY